MSLLPRAFISLAFITCIAFASIAKGQAPSVSKVEPPSWWDHHSINPVRLLVRGEHLQGAAVETSSKQLVATDLRVNDQGTYLFVNLRISPSTPVGKYPIRVRTSAGSTSFDFSIDRPLDSRENFQGITADDVIYLIMIDRFADGDTSNNLPSGGPPSSSDRQNSRAYHGGDLQGVIDHLPYLKELGVTALWLTPWYDNWNGLNNCDKPWCPNTYYHGYHAVDYYSVEDHFGDIRKLRELVSKAHALGIKVIQDQVANHVGSQHPWVTNPPLANWFHGDLKTHEANRFQNSTLLSPHANSREVRNTLDGWFSDDLPDLNQDEPEVARYEIQNSLWWVGMTGIDGIRQDTLQYVPRSFTRDLMNALKREYSRMWMVGEVFERDAAQTSFFIGGHQGWDGIDTGLSSVFDFSLWNVAEDVFTNKKPVKALRDQLKYDALYPDPNLVTVMTSNHDTERFMSLPGGTLDGAMLLTAFVMTTRGIPQLYAGEEIAMEGGQDPDNRRDFPGGFPGDARSAFDVSRRTPVEQRMWQATHDWIAARKAHSSLKHGKLIDLFYDDSTYAFARQDSAETVFVVINRSTSARALSLPVPDLADGANLTSIVGRGQTVVVKLREITLSVPANTAVAYVNTK